MKISLKWLQEYIDFDIQSIDLEKFTEKLAILGFEVENIEKKGIDFQNFVVGKIISKNIHPNADKLSICMVDIGDDDPVQIICGAPNVDTNQTVPIAKVGAQFPDFKIKKTKIRGIDSFGMICSEAELDISDNHDGIMILDDNYLAGQSLATILTNQDIILDLEITPNRPDILGYLGFAREVAFILDCKQIIPTINTERKNLKNPADIEVTIEKNSGCLRYQTLIVKGIEVKPSNADIQSKLKSIGLTPINNIVDITNIVMFETGHPLHAFDYDKINNKKIIIKQLHEKTEFIALDKQSYKLDAGIMAICDDQKPLALAGVIGGLESSVTTSTQNILLEVASFEIPAIRNTTNTLNIHTDASMRFERGVDYENGQYVIDRALELLQENSEIDSISAIVDNYPHKKDLTKINTRKSRIKKILGFEISLETAQQYLNKIGIKTDINQDKQHLESIIPSFRPDLLREIDIIEEIVRLYGYDRIPEIYYANIHVQEQEDPDILIVEELKHKLLNYGLIEIITKSMIDSTSCNCFHRKSVAIEAPLNEHLNTLQNSLLPSLIQVAKNNINQQVSKVNIFEIAKIFYESESGENIVEEEEVAILLSGKRSEQTWCTEDINYDFYDIKGIAEQIANDYHLLQKTKFIDEDLSSNGFHSEISLTLETNGTKWCHLGLIAKELRDTIGFDKEAYALTINTNKFIKILKNNKFHLQKISKYPRIIKDLSIEIEKELLSSEIEKSIIKLGGKFLQSVFLVDKYHGDQLPDNKKSYSYRMVFQSPETTLKDKQVEKYFKKVIKGLESKHNAKIR